ncbi:heterokaryon incompatibility protein-domain-containing protein [Echria macrotheca]|uniref:Heterokaryon incompatibility protein-domain-containing protein n=1 Tax=Echria macrotheca TaxID=438768 RepID=A0AAJ0FGM2_9PEZI|nr:heterokaryon incompatibility protein-domain-containing protein [Echria macrotheca]
MRLIETSTHQVEEFVGEIPDYAILSHTWNPNEPEVTLADMAGNGIRDLRNSKFNKIRDVCKKAKEVGLKYCWVDTCCIDKSSSAELSESINSMYRWYQNSAICYVFLFDLKPPQTLDAQLHLCRWFTRGWTLQELLAPSILVFFDSAWHPRGSIRLRPSEHWPSQYHGSDYTTDLSGRVSSITGIPSKALAGTSSLRIMRAAEIMSWASGRETTRPEDMAYSLLGLFDVNMPLLYGEGNKAFARLQEEIVVRRGDLSLLAWSPPDNSVDTCSALAVSPASFSWCRGYHVVQRRGLNVEVGITNRGLRLGVRLLKQDAADQSPT